MSRVIKFRAWHKDLGVMLTAYTLDQQLLHGELERGGKYQPLCRGFYGDNQQVAFPYDSAEWLQYTGLKDKAGVEIYEGDILRTTNAQTGQYYAPLRTVRWHSTSGRYGGIPLTHVCEVIGNIYSNPELLDHAKGN